MNSLINQSRRKESKKNCEPFTRFMQTPPNVSERLALGIPAKSPEERQKEMQQIMAALGFGKDDRYVARKG